MPKKILKGLLAVFALILIVYISFQVYNIVNPAYKSETAILYTVTDSVSCVGIAVRDETVIDNNAVGTLNYRVNDGDKVATGAVVADVFPSKTIARYMMEMSLLQQERDALQSAADSRQYAGSNLDTMTKQIYQQMVRLSSSIDTNTFSNFEDNKFVAYEQLATFSSASGTDLNFEGAISVLDTQIETIDALRYESSGEILANVGGYFVSYTDGYENLINKESIALLSPSDLDSLLSNTEVYRLDGNSCKVISDYTWYFAALIDAKDEKRFYEGQSLALDLNYALVKEIPVLVEKIETDAETGKTMLLFSCEKLNSDMTSLRLEDGEISFRNYKGIRIPRSAIRVVDNVVGVFTKYDNKVRFKAIDYDFETDDYILANPSQKSDELNLYDEVILEGKDLYDGKSLG